MNLEKVLFIFALIGSAMYVFDKIILILSKWRRSAKQSVLQPQEPAVEQETLIRALEKLEKLEQQIASMREDRITTLAETRRRRQHEIRQSLDPVSRVMSDAEAKAQQCKMESKQYALKAVEAHGAEKSRLLKKARELAKRADEYRAIANDTQDTAVESAVKKSQGASAVPFEMVE